MTITVEPMDEADVQTFVRIELEAFRSHLRMPMMWPRGYTDDLYAFYDDRKMESYNDSKQCLIKAVDNETGKIIGASEWTFAVDPTADGKKPHVDPNEQPPPNWPKEGNWPLRLFFKIEWEKWRREALDERPYIGIIV